MRNSDDDDVPASKAEFMWLMLELAQRDRARYREERADGWAKVAAARILNGKSAYPN